MTDGRVLNPVLGRNHNSSIADLSLHGAVRMNHVKEITEAHIRDVDAKYIAKLETRIQQEKLHREQLFTVLNRLDDHVCELLESFKLGVTVDVADQMRKLQRLREAFPYRKIIDAEKFESQMRIGTNGMNIDSIHG